MSSKVTIRQSKGVGVVGLLALVAGVLLVVAGAFTWWVVADKLADEGIVVSEDAAFLAGKNVNDPFSAFAQADVINDHALEMSDGMTYAELEQDDPRRDTVMNASFLRASLFTSVVSFGIAALVMGLGLLFVLVGWALRRLAGGPPVVVETTGTHGAHSAEPETVTTGSDSKRRPDTKPGSKDSKDKSQKQDDSARRTPTTPPPATTAPATSATPVVPAPSRPAPAPPAAPTTSTGTPAAEPADGGSAQQQPVATEPVRKSRSERASGAASPAPAGVRPAPAPSAGSELPAGPKGDARLEEIENNQSGGWASPADRVPPVDGASGSSKPGPA